MDNSKFEDKVTKILKDYLKSAAFTNRKLTDTPTDDLQVVNKKYVDTTVFARPINYYSPELNDGNVSGTATIDWSKGNVQYITMTADTTFTFSNPEPGQRMLLQLAGAYIPTWPANVRWPSGGIPTPTAAAGFKDLYAFVYSGIESLYDGIQSANFAIT